LAQELTADFIRNYIRTELLTSLRANCLCS